MIIYISPNTYTTKILFSDIYHQDVFISHKHKHIYIHIHINKVFQSLNSIKDTSVILLILEIYNAQVEMCLILCDEETRELGRKTMYGNCPHCGGKVDAINVETKSSCCFFVPICFQIKRKFRCSVCSKRLVLNYY